MTKIKCIFCETQYDIDEKNISIKAKKLRCAKCKKIFEYSIDKENQEKIIIKAPEQTKKEEETASEKKENTTSEIFARLDKTLEKYNIDDSNKSILQTIGWTTKKNKTLYITGAILLASLLLNYYKYDITRAVPQAEKIYAAIGIKSTVNGEGLSFSNVNKEDIDIDGINYMKLQGYIINNTNKDIKIPEVSINLLDKKGNLLDKTITKIDATHVFANDRTSFDISIRKPSALTKYVYLTFVE